MVDMVTKPNVAPVKKPQSPTDIIKSVLMRAGTLYFESVKSLNLVAGTSQKVVFTNQDNLPFLITKIVGYAAIASSFAKTFEYSFSLKDSGRQQTFMSSAVHGSALGSGDFPTNLDVPLLVRGSASFETEISNLNSVAINVYITYIGYKITG
jgi:hypothetical protein